MLDFSNRTELTYLADLVRAFGGVSGDMPYFLAGATARDLLLEHAHGINPGRNTHYLDAGNLQRLYTEASHLLDALDFDYEEAGAWLLGHDMARLLPESAHPRLRYRRVPAR